MPAILKRTIPPKNDKTANRPQETRRCRTVVAGREPSRHEQTVATQALRTDADADAGFAHPHGVGPLDVVFLLNNNLIGFTRSARKHRVERARVLTVGPDWTGRQLEVVAVIEQGRVVVMHAMDARPKLTRLYTERMNDGAP